MTDMPEPDARHDAARAAAEALADNVVPDAEILAAVQDGLLSVPAGSPSSWFDVPSQRSRLQPATTWPLAARTDARRPLARPHRAGRDAAHGGQLVVSSVEHGCPACDRRSTIAPTIQSGRETWLDDAAATPLRDEGVGASARDDGVSQMSPQTTCPRTAPVPTTRPVAP